MTLKKRNTESRVLEVVVKTFWEVSYLGRPGLEKCVCLNKLIPPHSKRTATKGGKNAVKTVGSKVGAGVQRFVGLNREKMQIGKETIGVRLQSVREGGGDGGR